VVYLKCLPATAARRTEQGEARPLLAGLDPAQHMRALLDEREQFYLLAPHQVDAERAEAAAVAASIMDLARNHAGW
jgi:shikimate kinase